MHPARELWTRIEALHAVTYFGEETRTAANEADLPGFWLGYFALRAAPLGPVGPAVVHATFHNFAPTFVARWVPATWTAIDPEEATAVRAAAAAATLRRLIPDIDAIAEQTTDLQAAVDAAPDGGRPLFAANRALERPTDPVAALWQRCTDLREHRGDGHVAALTTAGIDGIEAHVLLTIERATDPTRLQKARGWTPHDWDQAIERLRRRDLLTTDPTDGPADGPAAPATLTPAGATLRNEVEATTDRLAATALDAIGPERSAQLVEALTPPARAVWASGLLPAPNPIGLPEIV